MFRRGFFVLMAAATMDIAREMAQTGQPLFPIIVLVGLALLFACSAFARLDRND